MPKSFLERVGDRIRCFRESKGYTMIEVANLCSVEPARISAIERGLIKPPYSLYKDICDTIGITTGELFGCFKWTYTPPTEGKGRNVA